MSNQRPGDTIPYQKETEGVIDKRLEVALSAESGSGLSTPDLHVVGTPGGADGIVVELDDVAILHAKINPGALVYKWAGRIYFEGSLSLSGTITEQERIDLWAGSVPLFTAPDHVGANQSEPFNGGDAVVMCINWNDGLLGIVPVYATAEGVYLIDGPGTPPDYFAANAYLTFNCSFVEATPEV